MKIILKKFTKNRKAKIIVAIFIISLAVIFVKLIQDEPRKTDVSESAPTAKIVAIFVNENVRLKIDKLGINVPVVLNVDGADKNIYFDALESGVAHMQGTALPGDNSNVVIFGHSSSPVGYKGEFGETFATLNGVEAGDQILLANNSGQSLSYKIIEKKIIKADDISVLEQTTISRLTLITCWPVGTREKRLIVVAEQMAIKN